MLITGNEEEEKKKMLFGFLARNGRRIWGKRI